jgi:hypothetical protein
MNYTQLPLSKLTKITNLRSVWKHEASHFTQWLAEEDNLTLLGEELGIEEITLLETEASVGQFKVDMLCQETRTERTIIIENQLEVTDHNHLGKLITYAAGYNAEYIIWIVQDVREEHIKAIEWLNDCTLENIHFFLVKIELWQIGDSPLAPKFEVIRKPNEWSKTLRKAQQNATDSSDLELLRYNLWEAFNLFCQDKNTPYKPQAPKPKHWHVVSIGQSKAYLSLTAVQKAENRLSCELWIPNDKELYDFLKTEESTIEAELQEKLSWERLDGKKACRIALYIEIDWKSEEHWQETFTWLEEKASKFHKVFPQYIKQFKDQTP